ncbi:hypothetical protein LZT70_06610 [Staphylococcus epidermidis]|uniref:hypothetical protein n=1 Tax=Staphylococcus epidermidis TaxID=1282 RepID=UPI0020946BAA|nr:hypothetical protein [Staphylococcus epidermidis]MCO6217941.1 hypothetical protein [Staphylococcus epidermidis]
MKEYIKWFLEDVLGKPYKDMSTIKLWQIEKKSVQKMKLLQILRMSIFWKSK